MHQISQRAGVYEHQVTGYRAFRPNPLPPTPPLNIDDEMQTLLSDADRALGRLDGATEALPNPDLFVTMYVRKEALLSSQIEGTQTSLSEVLELEARLLDSRHPVEATDVVNYIRALNHGLERLSSLPLSLRLIREIHECLMEDTRGHDLHPGQFRTTQNWIGHAGCNLKTARFVPPSPEDMRNALHELESFLHDPAPIPLLLRIGLAHAQFETIHPFLDGNGRVGRLLITFLLCSQQALTRPLLYLSYFFKQNRTEYYDRLQAVRDNGDWEAWIKFFLRGVAFVANEAATVSRRIVALREVDRNRIVESCGRAAGDALKLHEALFQRPIVTAASTQEIIGREFPAANRLVRQLEGIGLLREVTGRVRGRAYRYEAYFRLFNDEQIEAETIAPPEATGAAFDMETKIGGGGES